MLYFWLGSSVAERLLYMEDVVGSIPKLATNII